jgi:hypothetical protein
MNKSLLVASLLGLGCAGANCGSGTMIADQLPGRWQSQSCESGGTVYVKRDFTLGAGTWQLTAMIYTDSACASPFVAVGAGGSYQVGAASAAVSGATEVDYHFSRRQVTPLSQAAVTTLTMAQCGSGSWTLGQAGDIGSTGCAPLGLPSNSACPTEMDLNQVSGAALYYGDRSADLCTARPSKLGPPLQRAQ